MKKYTLLFSLIFSAFSYGQITCPDSIKSNSTPEEPTFVLSNGQNGCNEVTWPTSILVDGLTYSYVSCSGGNLKYVMDAGQTPPSSFEVTVDYGDGSVCDYDANGALISPTLSNTTFETNDNQIKVYPNPIKSGNMLTISFNFKEAKVEIFSLLGRLVYSADVNNLDKKEVNTSSFNDGIYLLRIKTNDTTITKKIIITK